MRTGLINEAELAAEICGLEGGRVQVNIAQVTEVLNCTFALLGEWDVPAVIEIVQRHQLAARCRRLADRRRGGRPKGGG